MLYSNGIKTWLYLTALTACCWGIAFAQNQDGSSKPASPPVGATKTIVGCLTGYDGHYTLGASNDTLYLLQGDTALFKRYNAKLVRATGSVSEPAPGTSPNNVLSQQPPTLTVTNLKKVADGCN